MKTTAFDDYILDVLMRDLAGHDRSPSAYLVYVYLWRRTAEARGKGVRLSHKRIADDTGVSKSAVQGAVRLLNRRKLVRTVHDSPTAVPEHFVLRPWIKR